MNTIKIAVIGTGIMGKNHIRVLNEIENMQLVAICDKDEESLKILAKKYYIPHYCKSVEKLLETTQLDAIIIAVPTSEHYAIAKMCLNYGKNVLIEKPMASTLKECDELIKIATEKNTILMTGHIERFNPVIIKIKDFLQSKDLGIVHYIETVRSGPFPKRLYRTGPGVILDLAVHDLDLVVYLFDEIRQLYAHHITIGENKQDIYARVMFKTHNNIIGSSEFSWISPKKQRSISIFGDKGIITGDLLNQEFWYYENGSVEYTDNFYKNALWGNVSEGKIIKYPIKKEEPLLIELNNFYKLLINKKRIDPMYGKNALKYSLALLSSADENKIIFFNKE